MGARDGQASCSSTRPVMRAARRRQADPACTCEKALATPAAAGAPDVPMGIASMTMLAYPICCDHGRHRSRSDRPQAIAVDEPQTTQVRTRTAPPPSPRSGRSPRPLLIGDRPDGGSPRFLTDGEARRSPSAEVTEAHPHRSRQTVWYWYSMGAGREDLYQKRTTPTRSTCRDPRERAGARARLRRYGVRRLSEHDVGGIVQAARTIVGSREEPRRVSRRTRASTLAPWFGSAASCRSHSCSAAKSLASER